METLSTEIQESFKKENGMTVEDAMNHVKQWIKEGNYDSAEAGINELKKFFKDIPEIIDLESEIRKRKTETIDEVNQASVETIATSSDLSEVSKSEKFLAAIGYFWFLCVLPLALKPDSEFCKWHGKQALLLSILFFFFTAFGFIINVFIWWGLTLIAIFQLVISIIGFIKANRGKLWNMPLFGEIARKLPL